MRWVVHLVNCLLVNNAEGHEFRHGHLFHIEEVLKRAVLNRVALPEPTFLRDVVLKDVGGDFVIEYPDDPGR